MAERKKKKKYVSPGGGGSSPSQPGAFGARGTVWDTDRGTVSNILDLIARPSQAVAGAVRGATDDDPQSNPLSRGWENLAGRKKDTFSDVLGDVGMEEGIARTGLGLAGDVALDPLNLVGGGLAKGAGKVIGKTAGALISALPTSLQETLKAVAHEGEKVFSNYAGLDEVDTKTLKLADSEIRGIPERLQTEFHRLAAGKNPKQVDKLAAKFETTRTPEVKNQILGDSLTQLMGRYIDPKVAAKVVKDKLAGLVPTPAQPNALESILTQAATGKPVKVAKKGPKPVETFDNALSVLPQYVREAVEQRLKKPHAESRNVFGRAMDKGTGVFRETATIWNPKFHTTNHLGNLWNSAIGGNKPYEGYGTVRKLAKADPQALKGIKIGQHSGEEVLEAFGRHGMSSGLGDLIGHVDTGQGLAKQAIEAERLKSLPLAQRYRESPLKAFRQDVPLKLGNTVEKYARQAAAINQLKKGASMDDAILHSKKYLFDYGDLTDTEQKLRRVLPFYTFTRKNLPLQLEGAAKRPQLLAGYEKTRNAIEETTGGDQVEKRKRPEWLEDQGAIHMGGEDPTYVTPYLPMEGLNLLEQPDKMVNNIANMVTPPAKMLAEIAANKSFFTGQKLWDDSTGDGYLTGRTKAPAAAYAPGLKQLFVTQMKQTAEDRKLGRPAKGEMSAPIAHALSNIPFGSNVGKVGASLAGDPHASNVREGLRFAGVPVYQQKKRDAIRQQEAREKAIGLGKAKLKKRETQIESKSAIEQAFELAGETGEDPFEVWKKLSGGK